MRPIKKGSTDQSVVIRIIDSSDGTPETGVDYDTAGIDLWYRREGATKTSITEAALASLDAAHSDGGIEHIGDGYYRLDLPDAAFAAGADGVMVGGTVTDMIVIGAYVPLVDYDPYDSVRMGMTALPNAAADAAGGLPISDAGGLDLDAQIGTDIDDLVSRLTAARAGYLDNLNGHTPQTGDNYARLGAPAGASVSADIAAVKTDTGNLVSRITATLFDGITSLAEWLGLIAGKQSGDATARTEIRATGAGSGTYDETTDSLEALRDTEPHGTAMRGTDSAALASVCTETRLAELDAANLPTDVAAIPTNPMLDTEDGSSFTAIPWNASWDTEVQSEVQDAIEANNLDHLCKTATGSADMTAEVVDNSILSRIIANGDTSAFDPSTDGLQPLRDHVGDGTNLTEAGGTGDHLTAIPWNASWDAEVQSECTDALNVYDPPTKTEMDSAFTEIKGATWDSLTDTLEHIRNKQTDIETDTQDLQTQIGTAGDGLTGVPWNAAWDAEVQSECADALNAYDPPTKAELDTAEANIIADTEDIQSRIPAALTAGGNIKADALAISGSTDAADNLEASAETIVVGAAAAGTLSTTQMTTNLTEATDDHYNGRIIIWTSGVLQNQATDITDYDGASKMLTYTATTEAPSDGDTFVIV